jgi:hypothetical protein
VTSALRHNEIKYFHAQIRIRPGLGSLLLHELTLRALRLSSFIPSAAGLPMEPTKR